MTLRRLAAYLAPLAFWAAAAQSMPGEMPWDHYGAPGGPDCTACHFDSEAARQSPSLHLEGLPEKVAAGETYALALRLEAEGLDSAGFLMRAEMPAPDGKGKPSGRFIPADGRTQADEGAIRSTAEGARQKAPGAAEWRFSWQAPEELAGMVTIYIAAVAANDDLSPLGDRVHLKQVTAGAAP